MGAIPAHLLHPNVAPHYREGLVLPILKPDLSSESTADLTVTLAHNLDMMVRPGTHDAAHYAHAVTLLWRELALRGITLA